MLIILAISSHTLSFFFKEFENLSEIKLPMAINLDECTWLMEIASQKYRDFKKRSVIKNELTPTDISYEDNNPFMNKEAPTYAGLIKIKQGLPYKHESKVYSLNLSNKG
jgi:hypothetical protein